MPKLNYMITCWVSINIKTNFINGNVIQGNKNASWIFNPLSTNPTIWSNILKNLLAKADKLSVFDHFLGLALKGLTSFVVIIIIKKKQSRAF